MPVRLSRPVILSLAVAILAGPLSLAAVVVNPAVNGLSHYVYDYTMSPSVMKEAGPSSAPVLFGQNIYPWYKTIDAPLFEFPIDPSLAGQQDIVATARFYLTQPGVDARGDGVQFGFYGQADAVLEYHANAGNVITTLDPTRTGWVEIDVSAQVQQAVDNHWNYIGFIFYPNHFGDGSAGDMVYVASRTNAGYEPQLAVGAVPEPASLGLLGLGALALLTRRNRAR